MPPKRRPRSDITPDPAGSSSQEVAAASSTPLSQPIDAPDAKKPKLAEPNTPSTEIHSVSAKAPSINAASLIIDDGEAVSAPSVPKPTLPLSAEEMNPDLVDDGRPICQYDENCYRKNPQHFQQFRHPELNERKRLATPANGNGSGPSGGSVAADSSVPKLKPSSSGVGAVKRLSSGGVSAQEVATTVVRADIELYKTVMKTVLVGQNKISSEGRKLLKSFRQSHSITEQEHDQLLGQYGWTPDEYEDGEKNVEAYELDEERDLLRNGGPDAFKVFTIFKHQKRNNQQESVWARASSKFYQTMSKAQANFVIKSIGLIVNAKTAAAYEARRQAIFETNKQPVNEEWGFHGTSIASIQGISATGFKMPDELKKMQQPTKGKVAGKVAGKAAGGKGGASSASAAQSKVTFLDDGYFGNGLYFSLYSDYALFYSEERESNQILLCKVLTGKAYKCTERMDGEGLKKGFDSHYSPQGNEIIVFRGDQILPRYIVTFESRDAEEREQES